MDYNITKKEIILNRKLNELDNFVIDFCTILDDKYVLVSGYVSIIFGRSRATEDVDLLVPSMNFAEFEKLWVKIYSAGFECLNTSNIKGAFEMWKEHAIRFAKINKPIPNMEFKMIKKYVEKYSFEKSIFVLIDKQKLKIFPLEMQIAYKLDLGSEKDMEDAKHLYVLFKEKLDNKELLRLIKFFKVEKKFEIIK
jgi:hypothetical protein